MYRRKQAEKATGIPARRIQFYTEFGLINLDDPTPGRGRERKYSRQNILELLIIKELAEMRVELSEIRRIMVELPGKLWPDFFNVKPTDKVIRQIILHDDGRIHYRGTRDEKGEFLLQRILGESPDSPTSKIVVNVSKLADSLDEKLRDV